MLIYVPKKKKKLLTHSNVNTKLRMHCGKIQQLKHKLNRFDNKVWNWKTIKRKMYNLSFLGKNIVHLNSNTLRRWIDAQVHIKRDKLRTQIVQILKKWCEFGLILNQSELDQSQKSTHHFPNSSINKVKPKIEFTNETIPRKP